MYCILIPGFFYFLVPGTLLIIIGAMLIGGFGVVREPNHSLEDLIRLYHRPTFIAYFSVLEFFTVIMLMATHYLEYRMNRMEVGSLPESKYMKMADLPDLKMKLGIRYNKSIINRGKWTGSYKHFSIT